MNCKAASQSTNVSDYLPFPSQNVLECALKKATRELRETPERKRSTLQQLNLMLQECPKTKKIDFEEDFLVHYLRANKYVVQKTFHQLQNYVDLTQKHTGLFKGFPDEYFSSNWSSGIFNILPKRCPDGCLVLNVQFQNWNPSKMPFEDFKKLYILIYMQLIRDPMAQINGFKVIYDLKETSLLHLRFMTLHNLYLLYHIPLDCCPSRIKEVHVLNQTIVFTAIWKLISPFLSEKLKSRVFFHSVPERMLEFFPPSMLPVKYGGDVRDIDSSKLLRSLNKEQKQQTVKGQPNIY